MTKDDAPGPRREGRVRLPVLPPRPDADRARNVQVPLELRRRGRPRAGGVLLRRVGLADRAMPLPGPAIGRGAASAFSRRARVRAPARILFADEPTGNLDAANGANVVALLGELNREVGTTLVLVSHDPDLAARARRVIRLRDGAVVEDAVLADAPA